MPAIAFGLVLVAALIHALWNFVAKKSGGDIRVSLLSNIALCILWAPVGIWFMWRDVAAFGAVQWSLVAASGAIHVVYFVTLLRGYRLGDLSVVYPLAGFYINNVPQPVRTSVENFVSNLAEPMVFANDVLQLRLDAAATTVGRFAINSTVGLAGISDVASRNSMPQQSGDFDAVRKLYFYRTSYGSEGVTSVLFKARRPTIFRSRRILLCLHGRRLCPQRHVGRTFTTH